MTKQDSLRFSKSNSITTAATTIKGTNLTNEATNKIATNLMLAALIDGQLREVYFWLAGVHPDDGLQKWPARRVLNSSEG